jgi:hypothetical protein
MFGASMGLGAILSGARAFLGKISPRTWLIIGCAVAAFIGFLAHQHYAHKALAAAEQRGEATAYANVEKQARALEAKANAVSQKIAADLKEKNREENARVAAAADAIRLRGPGAARCSGPAFIPAAASGSQHPAAKAGTAVDQLPDQAGIDLIGLPFAGAVTGAEDHDALLNEAQSWRTWYATFSAQWVKWQKDAEKARQP